MDAVRDLFREYARWVGSPICFESFEREVAGLPGQYAPHEGRLLIAIEGQEIAGCAALRLQQEGIAEMKRLYVRPQFQGKGLGRRLIGEIIEESRGVGY